VDTPGSSSRPMADFSVTGSEHSGCNSTELGHSLQLLK
jgi:hypothetical protein